MAQLSKYRSNKTRQYPRKGPHLFSSFGSFHRHSVLSSLLAPVKPPGADLSYLFASLGAVSRRLHGLYWKNPLGGSGLSELSRTVFEPNGHDLGEVSGPVAIRFLSHQQQAAATQMRTLVDHDSNAGSMSIPTTSG